MSDWDDLVRRPAGIHIAVTALLGETAEHLRRDHGLDPQLMGPDAKRFNAGLHLDAHPWPTSEDVPV